MMGLSRSGAGGPGGLAAIAGGSDAARPVSEAEVLRALGTVLDPELGMSIVDLGLVYGVRIQEGDVEITMTLTAPGCPIHDVMPEWVRTAVGRVAGVERVDVTVTFDPPWSPERIRREATRLRRPPSREGPGRP